MARPRSLGIISAAGLIVCDTKRQQPLNVLTNSDRNIVRVGSQPFGDHICGQLRKLVCGLGRLYFIDRGRSRMKSEGGHFLRHCRPRHAPGILQAPRPIASLAQIQWERIFFKRGGAKQITRATAGQRATGMFQAPARSMMAEGSGTGSFKPNCRMTSAMGQSGPPQG